MQSYILVQMCNIHLINKLPLNKDPCPILVYAFMSTGTSVTFSCVFQGNLPVYRVFTARGRCLLHVDLSAVKVVVNL